MITTTTDRHLYIGGSEANNIYANYNTKTFKKWWSQKLSGFYDESYRNLAMDVGTILEHDIVDLYEAIYQVKGVRDKSKTKGIARANTDYIQGDAVKDVKATTKAFEWYLKDTVPINYRRQLLHYCYVFDLDQASIIAYQVDDDVLDDPFAELVPAKLYEIDVPIEQVQLIEHQQKLEYLAFCKDMNIFPKG